MNLEVEYRPVWWPGMASAALVIVAVVALVVAWLAWGWGR